MQMIRQYHHREYVERIELPDFSHDVAKQTDLFSEKIAFPVGEIDGEKVGGSGNVRSTISHLLIPLNVGLMKR